MFTWKGQASTTTRMGIIKVKNLDNSLIESTLLSKILNTSNSDSKSRLAFSETLKNYLHLSRRKIPRIKIIIVFVESNSKICSAHSESQQFFMYKNIPCRRGIVQFTFTKTKISNTKIYFIPGFLNSSLLPTIFIAERITFVF